MDSVGYPKTRLPVLFRGDAVVIGGSLAGVAAALELARAGKSVAVVEPRTYLGWELAATWRPWLAPGALSVAASDGAGADDGEIVEPLASFVEKLRAGSGATGPAPDSPDSSGELPFAMDSFKLHLEDALLEAGVKLVYASLPLTLESGAGVTGGVVIGNKTGRQFLAASLIVDATLAYSAESGRGTQLVRTLDFDGLSHFPGRSLTVPEGLGVVGAELLLHRGHRGERHALVEFALSADALAPDGASLRVSLTDPFMCARIEMRARVAAMSVAMHLMANEPAFEGAFLAGSSLESVGMNLLAGASSWQMSGADGFWRLDALEAAPVSGVPDPFASCRAGSSLGRRLAADWAGAVTSGRTSWPVKRRAVEDERVAREEREAAGDSGRHPGRSKGVLGAVEIREAASPPRMDDYEPVSSVHLPVLRHCQAIVVGGGTSGATAATVAAREGLATVLVEMNPGLGGTGTYGGVNDYWFGRRVGFAGRLNDAVAEMHGCLRHAFPASDVPRWNIEAKAQVLARAAIDAGVEVLLDSFAIASIVEDGSPARVRGVVVATRFGPVAVLADVVIDATGDGDVAVAAGASHVYGSGRGRVAMWYSLAQFALPGHTRNNFTSSVDVGDIEDYTRAILAGRRRRRSEKELHDHGIYLAPRETRHVLGEVVLTLSDQLLHRAWPDVVNIAYSNNDIKGHTTSDWVRLGLISPNLEVEIPYRALIPRDLDNLLTVGKAISATHDALPAIRMQADLENLGGVAALAAAQAFAHRTSLREIDVRVLQERLVAEGVLPAEVLASRLEQWSPDEAEIDRLIAELPWQDPLYAYSDMPIGEVYRERLPIVDITCAGKLAVPLLEREYSRANGLRKLRLAQALAFTGSQAGVETLVETVMETLASGELPLRAKGIRHAVAPPDQGAMPDVVYLIHALGMTRDRRALVVWQRVTDLLRDVTDEDVREPSKDIFDYVDSICVGAERLGDPAALPILAQLHSCAPFRNQHTREPFQADYFRERQAYLEVMIGRAMARSGDVAGLRILSRYLPDTRTSLAAHAHAELVEITGVDIGWQPGRWDAWLEENMAGLRPRPAQEPSDAVATWAEEISIRRTVPD